MKHTRIIMLVFLVLAAQAAAQEYKGITLEMTVNNNAGREQVLSLGLREDATTGLDPMLDEAELPPQPPNEIFDARLVSTPGKSQLGLGSFSDFRALGTGTADITETYTIAYQAGINASGVTLSWGPELPGRIRAIVIDGENQAGNTSKEFTFASGQITVEVTFNPSPLTFEANPNPLLFDANNRDPLPSKTLTIMPRGDVGAAWNLSSDAEWITIEPEEGTGQQTVQVTINTRTLPAGTYDGTIYVRSLMQQGQLDVPVQLVMVVGVADAPVPGQLYLGQNYPNPFGASAPGGILATRIDLDLGPLAAAAAPSLRVHDMLGREVMDLSDRLQLRDGRQSVIFDAAALPGGVYTYTLRHADLVRTRSMILTK
jgi:hypothetical protein